MATIETTDGRLFSFLRLNERQQRKPRTEGITEIRGPHYTAMGEYCVDNIHDTMGSYVDSLKFASGSFALMPRRAVLEM